MSRSDGALGLFKAESSLAIGEAMHRSVGRLMTIADLGLALEGAARLDIAKPVHAGSGKPAGQKPLLIPDNDIGGLGEDVQDVSTIPGGDAEALALADGEAFDAIMGSEDFA